MTKKHQPRRFQSTRKTGLLFITKPAYDAAIAKLPVAKQPETLNAATSAPDLTDEAVAELIARYQAVQDV